MGGDVPERGIISVKVPCKYYYTRRFKMDEQQFLVVKDSSNIDVLDENLYCYESAVFTLTPAIQNRASLSLLRKVKQFIDSVPAAQKANDYVQSKTEYIPRLDLIPEEIKQALQNGTAEIILLMLSFFRLGLQLKVL